jgi:DNA-binding transcriptional LysR family regulator
VIAYSLMSTGDVWSFDGPRGAASVRVSPRLHTNSGDTCRAAALAGQGIVLQPTFLVGADLRAGTLVEVLPGWRSVEIGVHAVHPARRHVPQKVRAAIDFLVEAFRERPWPE